jgi:uncharacterized protein YyaL (SSP411 family)
VPNRLAASTSPYLLQHATNPVDWFEWGDEAFAEARRRDVPLLLSVGYAACHWCHVMAHESFEDPSVAAVMNASFVCVKVDREERPDVDAVYMAATQAMSGQGGWPMTVFATPDGEPFFAGTYFPPRPAHGRPSFRQLLDAVREAWEARRDEVRHSAGVLREHLRSARLPTTSAAGAAEVDPSLLDQALQALRRDLDADRGGFGGAPKFPPSMLLEWLLRHHARRAQPEALAMAGTTLEAMARGGIYDQLGGGFARYSVDADWVVPHFEKMLYDNALLLRVYVHAWRATGSALARRVSEETAEWLLRELRTPEGGFASSLDADSADAEGVQREGAYYVWTPEELRQALGAQDAAWAAAVWAVTDDGTFEGGASVLQLPDDVPVQDRARYADVRRRLLAVRARRAAPGRDDKVVAGWNGLAIAALAEAGAILERAEWVRAAAAAADLVLDVHTRGARAGAASDGADAPVDGGEDGPLRVVRTSRSGAPGEAPGVLEDYAHLADGLLALYSVTGSERWASAAASLLETVLEQFPDGRGAFYDTAVDDTDPVLANLGRPQEVADGPTPSGSAAAAGVLVALGALTGSARHRDAGERALARLLPLAPHAPRAVGWALAVAEAVLDGPREVAVVGPLDDPRTRALHRTALLATAPGAVVALADPASEAGHRVPLVRDRPLVDGRPAAYVCRGFTCRRPTTEPAELATSLT